MPRRRMPQAVFLTRQGDYAEAERIERELHGVLARLTRVLRLHAERWPAASPAYEPSVTGRYASHMDFQPYNRARASKHTHNHAQSRNRILTHSHTHSHLFNSSAASPSANSPCVLALTPVECFRLPSMSGW